MNGWGDAGPSSSGLSVAPGGHPRYQQVRYINKGTSGYVMQALDRETGGYVALKYIERGAKITKYVEREVLNHQRLIHPHIVAIKEVFLTDNYLVLVMEYAAGGDLHKYVSRHKGLSEEEARWFFQQLMIALDFCHKMGVANRDIKLENCLLRDKGPRSLVKLADFGFSKDENFHSVAGSCVGTPAYLAPEVLSAMQGHSYNAKKADVWSCGVLLYMMVTGRYPFRRAEDEHLPPGQRLSTMLQRILQVSYRFPASRQLSDSCRDLISRILVADPLQRLSVQQVLQHPWCSQGLQPSVLVFNDSLVAKTMANPPSPQVLQEVRSMIREAQLSVYSRRQQQRREVGCLAVLGLLHLQLGLSCTCGALLVLLSLVAHTVQAYCLGGDGGYDGPQEMSF